MRSKLPLRIPFARREHRGNTLLTCFSCRYLRALIACLISLGAFLLTGCEPSQRDITNTQEYKAGYEAGYKRGLNEGNDFKRGYEAGRDAGIEEARPQIRKEGYDIGYADGFDAARPGTSGRPTGLLRFLIIGAALLGMIKILGSLVVFTLIVIFKSQNSYETTAKFLVTTLSVIVLFWLSHSLTIGFSTTLEEIFLKGGAGSTLGKTLWGAVGAMGMYVFLYTLEMLVKRTKGHRNLQAICVFVSSFAALVLVPFFLSLYRVPNLQAYVFFDVILGVIIGGVLFIVRTVISMGDQQLPQAAKASGK